MTTQSPNEVKLKSQFPADAHSIRVLRKSNGRAWVAVHLQSRDIMDRLDEVFGVGGWADEYTVIYVNAAKDEKGNDGWTAAVQCTLTVNFDAETDNTHQDIGTGTGKDGIKGAYADALKRAAVKLGIGRYLYDVKLLNGYEYDSQSYQLTPAGLFQARSDLATILGQDQPASPVTQAQRPPAQRTQQVAPPANRDVDFPNRTERKSTPSDPFGDAPGWGNSAPAPRQHSGASISPYTDYTTNLVDWAMAQTANDKSRPSPAQNSALVKAIDKVTGQPDSAFTVMAALTGTEQPQDWPRGVVKELLDTVFARKKTQDGEWIDNPLYKEANVEAIKELWDNNR